SNISLPSSASLPSNVSRASDVSQASNVSSPGPEQYYVRFGNEVRTFPFDEVKRRFQAGEITAETWICKVGDSEWRKIADAHALDLGPPPELQSVTSVYDRPPTVERAGASPSAFKRVWHRAILQENRLMLAVWVLLGTLGLTLILQRSGALYAAFSWIGQERQYEALETDLLGGPSSGTVRSAEKLWAETIPAEKFPFSELKAQSADAPSDKKTQD